VSAYLFLTYHLDGALFTVLSLLALWASRRHIRRNHAEARFPSTLPFLIGLIVVAGLWFADGADNRERTQIRQLVSGLAPTFAYEIETLGHAQLTLDTPPDDPTYLAIIEREKTWLRFNPDVADIYTYRRLTDGRIVFIADSETDYDHNGRYEGEREQRTSIGEPYDTPTANTLKALGGQAVFDAEIVTDEWGTWVSFDQPLLDHDGRVEAVLGIDFPAEEWISAILVVRGTCLSLAFVLVLTVVSSTTLNILMQAEIEDRKRTEAKLLAAKEAADQGNRAKSDFLASMSHEFHTPMNGIIGFSSLLLDTSLTAEQREYATTLAKSADSLLVLLNDILDLSKIESGRILLERVPYDFDAAIENLRALLVPSAQAKGLGFVVENRTPGLILAGDPLRVRQILLNLLANAIKFTSAGEVRLETEWTPLGPGSAEGWLRCQVRDTGIGIPADKLDRLFKRFSQVDGSITRRYGGTGLGLVISDELTSLMGGAIEVASTPGQGSVFTVRIPATRTTEPQIALLRPARPTRGG
jgi:two-component system, sensor histidine kinase